MANLEQAARLFVTSGHGQPMCTDMLSMDSLTYIQLFFFNFKGKFSTFGLGIRKAHLIAYPWLPINSSLTQGPSFTVWWKFERVIFDPSTQIWAVSGSGKVQFASPRMGFHLLHINNYRLSSGAFELIS